MWSLIYNVIYIYYVLCAQLLSCVSLFCEPMVCSPPGSSVHGIFPGKYAGVGCYFLLQGISPTQGSNLRPCIAAGFFTHEPLGKPLLNVI